MAESKGPMVCGKKRHGDANRISSERTFVQGRKPKSCGCTGVEDAVLNGVEVKLIVITQAAPAARFIGRF